MEQAHAEADPHVIAREGQHQAEAARGLRHLRAGQAAARALRAGAFAEAARCAHRAAHVKGQRRGGEADAPLLPGCFMRR